MTDEKQDNFLLKVNEQAFECNQKIASKLSPLVRDFFKTSNSDLENQSAAEKIFETTIPNISNDDDLSILNKILKKQKIKITKENYEVTMKIGKHFLMENIVEQCKMFHKFELLISFLNNDKNFQILLHMEKIFLEMKEENIEDTYNQCIVILSEMPLDCFYNFIIHIFVCSNKYYQKMHLIIQLLEKIERSITGIISSFINYLLNIINLKKSPPKNSTYISKINLFVYELCAKVNHNFLREEIRINSSNFNVPELLDGIIIFDKGKQTIRINRDNIINYKSNLGNDLACIWKEINAFFQGETQQLFDNNNNNNNNKNNNNNYSNKNYSNKNYSNNNDNINNYNNNDNNNNKDNSVNSKISILLESIQRDELDFFQNNFQELESNLFFSTQNQSMHCSLIEYSAFFGSIRCFQFLVNNKQKFDIKQLSSYAIAGGNPDIIHFCERNCCLFDQRSLTISIKFHQHFLTKWLFETKNIKPNQDILSEIIDCYNIDALKYFINRKFMINKILLSSIYAGNNMLFGCFIGFEYKNIELFLDYNDDIKTVLLVACGQNNIEIVKILLTIDNLDINSFYFV